MRTKTDKGATYEALAARGIATVEISFSGGNDEGGAESVEFRDADDGKVAVGETYVTEAYGNWQKDEKGETFPEGTPITSTGDHRQYRRATDDEIADAKLRALVEAPIYERYGSFAGEFYVSGTVTWDVAERTCKSDYEEDVKTTEHHDEEW